MSPGLYQNALAGIDEQDGEVGVRCPRRHIPRVLLVTRCIGDDEGSSRRSEESIGHIDGDALLAFSLETVHEKGKVDWISRGAVASRVFRQR